MDPITAVGLASNVAQLVELSWKIVSKTHEIYEHGALPEHRDAETVTTDLQNVNNKLLGFLQESEKDFDLSADDEALRRLCESSNKIANELIKRLQKLQPGDEHRGWKSMRKALKSVWIKSELDETAARLQGYRAQLHTRLLVSVREKVDSLDQSTKIIATSLSDHRVLLNTSQEIQTDYLTRLITAQHDKTREVFSALALGNGRASPHPETPSGLSGPTLLESDARTAIFEAVDEEDIAKLRRVLGQYPSSIFALNDTGQTALHLAALAGNIDLVTYLIRNGARVNPDDDDGKLPLHCAVESGSLPAVHALITKGADLHVKDGDGRLPRDLCDPSSLLRWILARNGNVDARNSESQTALCHFALQGDAVAVGDLLDQGANAEATGLRGRTPLLHAAVAGHVEVVALLLTRGANVAHVSESGSTALMLAASEGHTRVGELLLDAGAEIDAVTPNGHTALMPCCTRGYVDTGLMLLRRGAKVDTEGGYPDSPLHLAAQQGHSLLVEAILDRGGDIDTQHSRSGSTVLAVAC